MGVYNGDISDTILAKLSSYYNEYAKLGTPYIIYRPDQYTYRLVFGDTDDYIHFTNACIVEYYNSNNYGSGYVLSVTDNMVITVDSTGWTGYVYSSSPDFVPSRYVSSASRCADVASIVLMGTCIFVALYCFIISLFKKV